MSDNRRLLAVLLAFLSILIVVGSLFTALVEGGFVFGEPTSISTQPPPTATGTAPFAATASPLVSPSQTPVPTECDPPLDWHPYTVQSGDTLAGLAGIAGLTLEEFARANCLAGESIELGEVLHFPQPVVTTTSTSTATDTATTTSTTTQTPSLTATTSPTISPVACGQPANWVSYTVKIGDTLFNLSQRLGVTVSQLQFANCLGSSTNIQVGQSLWVPFIPPPLTGTPTRTPTVTPTSATATPSPTNPPVTPSPTPTGLPSGTPTSSPSPTSLPSSTPTGLPTATAPPEPTPTPTQNGYPPPPTGTASPTETSPPYP